MPLFSKISRVVAFMVILLWGGVTQGEVRLPAILASHMVIQRDRPVHLWGWADGGETVTASFRGRSASATADELGIWSLYLPPGAAGGPFELTVAGKTNTVTLNDVLVGDLWVASGQSNMEFEMRRAATAAEDLPKAANSRIRLLIVKKKFSDYPLTDLDGTWEQSTPDSAREFSAVGWYFAKEIEAREHVPVGVIDSTWGGTVAEAWTSMTALGNEPGLAPIFVSWGKMTGAEAKAILQQQARDRLSEEAKAQGKPEPVYWWHPVLDTWGPAQLFNGMIAPLTPLPIRGVIWYQGESNSKLDRAQSYERLFQTMIKDWRRQWGEGGFPFLYVQISNFISTPEEDWATIREAQRRALELRNTGMAVSIDVGNPNDVHPTDKLTVGHRLALAAEAITYGENLTYMGPMFRQVTREGDLLRVWFDSAAGLQTRGGGLTGFEIAGADGSFVPAEAKIEGETVVLSNPAVPSPVAARYGWANSPQCHLFNGAGLPASPFTSIR